MSTETTEVHSTHDDHEGMTKKRIIKVALILSAITCVEFIIALVIVPHYANFAHYWANPLYIMLTLLKAFYIVAFFMHLKFEKTGLIIALVVPVLFIIGLILVLTNESHHWITLRM
jgi:cytochrome c oxidase subunit 4